jgi:hypothetical protein
MKTATAIIAIFVTMPIWIYLQYKILELVNASELMWFLFWVYVPVVILTAVIKAIIDEKS